MCSRQTGLRVAPPTAAVSVFASTGARAGDATTTARAVATARTGAGAGTGAETGVGGVR